MKRKRFKSFVKTVLHSFGPGERWDVFRIWILLSAFALSLIVVLFFMYFPGADNTLSNDFQVGMPAKKNYILEKDLLYLDYGEMEIRKKFLTNLVVPVFVSHPEVIRQVQDNLKNFHAHLKGRIEGGGFSPNDKRLHGAYSGLFQKEELEFLSQRLSDKKIFDHLHLYAEEFMQAGIFRLPDNFEKKFPKGLIDVRRTENRSSSDIIEAAEVITRQNLKEVLMKRTRRDGLGFEAQQAVYLIALTFFEENYLFDENETARKIETLQHQAEPVFRSIPKDSLLIRRGNIVSEADMDIMRYAAAGESKNNRYGLPGTIAYLALIFFLAVFLFRPPLTDGRLSHKQFLLVISLNVLYLVIALSMRYFLNIPSSFPLGLLLPTALVSIFISVLVSYRAGVIDTAILSLGQLLLGNVVPESIVFVFFSGIIGTRIVRNAKQRIDLVKGGILLAFANSAVAAVLALLGHHTFSSFFVILGAAFLNGFLCGMLNLAFLPLLEHLLNAATKFRLLELSDLNAPILKRMLNLAPGTYNHSVSVANLAETACSEIGSDALLARVGAYYHDIGKIDQAEYFIENQVGFNKHDVLKPSLSSAIIKSHVKIGVEQAENLNLPEEVREIIAQHHGSGLIRVFYQRAVENDKGDTSREDYSYTGSPPTTKEAAIVMLADSVEAASRVLKKPTVSNLEKFVITIISEKVDSGQLLESTLTLKDLGIVRRSFVRVLAGYFHSRLEYPKVKELER